MSSKAVLNSFFRGKRTCYITGAKIEHWFLQAIDLLFEAVPPGVRLNDRQLNTVEDQFNYIYACEHYRHIKMGSLIKFYEEDNMKKLKERNPEYEFK